MNSYFEQAKKLLPPGLIWAISEAGRLAEILRMSSGQLSSCHLQAEKLTLEASPQTSDELLAEWEEVSGLPDNCGGGNPALTITERQELVIERLTRRGSMAVERFLEMSRNLGYDVTIKEYKPFTCGRSFCSGPNLLGRRDARFFWRVTITSPRMHWFKAGRYRCGERLGWGTPAADIECYFLRRKPAHTDIIFEYQVTA
ncbi:MAG: DUF2313 domain-containing protein [Deltaproteobacteria bacterium]|nr:DUF2313 domain-containing protein [Deltaproteobacteria bacterium]